MFQKLRNSGKSKCKSSQEPTLGKQDRAAEERASTPSEPPRLELSRNRPLPSSLAHSAAIPPKAGPAPAVPPRPATSKSAHLKSVGPHPVAQPLSRPVSQPIARPAAPTRPVIPPYPVPGARGASAMTSGAEVQSLGRLMLVGPDIRLTGEIKACERLVVEGAVEGEVSETERLEIGRGGRFQGSAEVEHCMVDGLFEGELDVRGVLTLKPNGRVQGTVRYGEIEIERGGRIAGSFGPRGESQIARPVTASGPQQA